MSIPMSDIYTIMHYLKEAKIDRVYPVNKHDLNSFTGNKGVFKLNNHTFLGVDEIQFVATIFPDDNVIETTETFNVGCSLCIDREGLLPRVELEPVEVDFTYGEPIVINFKVDANFIPADTSQKFTGVHSIVLSLDKEIHRCKVKQIIFRSNDYTYTVEDINQCYLDGQNYVKDRLNNSRVSRKIDDIPSELERYVLMCAGAYGWLTIWENEAKPAKEPKSESNNYADRLFGRVDIGIDSYLKSILNDYDSNFINTDICRSTRLRWGLGR